MPIHLDILWSYTSCLRARVRNNNDDDNDNDDDTNTNEWECDPESCRRWWGRCGGGGGGRRGGMTLWTSSCDPSATSSAVLFRSSGMVPLLQFIVRVDSVRDGLLLVLSSVVNRDRCPQFFGLGFGVLQYVDKVVDVPGDAVWLLYEACGRISHIFYVLALFAWFFVRSFHELLVSGSHLPLCVATVHGDFWTHFLRFPRAKWTPSSPRSSHPGNLNIISVSSIWQSPRASVCVASGRSSVFFYVKMNSEVLAQFAP